jgi:hypothetical protein
MGSTKPISKGQGERYTATVVPNGYLWRETTYASLSTYTAVAKVPLLRIEIVKRSDDMKGFVLLPRRWVVERTSQEGKQSALRSSHLSRKPCPRNSMAGPKRVVSWLAEELVRQGHRVALFASADPRRRRSSSPARHKA